MKIMVISDTHNDINYVRAVIDIFNKEKFDKLYVLGDIGVDSISIINEVYDKVLAVKGNCDSYEEEDKALFNMPYLNFDYNFGKLFVLSHGNYYNPYTYDQDYNVFLFGHYHTSIIRKIDENKIAANPGSLAEPRDGIHSYMTIDEKGIKIIDINSNSVINSYNF